MALGQNPFNPSRTLPTLAAIQQRRSELVAYQARQEAAQALATPDELHTEEETPVPEEFHFTQDQEEQQENDELQEPYADEESEPSDVFPPRSSAPPPPALDGAAFHSRTTAETRPYQQGNRRWPRTVRKSLDQSTKAGNRHEHPRNRPIRRLRRTLPPKGRIGRLRRTLPPR